MKTYIDVIKEVMPKNADIIENKNFDGYTYSIDWLLEDDKNRKSKRSKTILIKISREAVDDVNALPESRKDNALDRLRNFLLKNLGTFEPDHNNPVNIPNPIEKWVVTTQLLT